MLKVSVSSGYKDEKVNRAKFPSVSTSLEGPHTQEILARGDHDGTGQML